MVGGGWATILTNETLAETPESSPPKNKIWTKYKDLKSHIWNSFYENIISDIRFYIRPHVFLFFLISDFLAKSLKANKN